MKRKIVCIFLVAALLTACGYRPPERTEESYEPAQTVTETACVTVPPTEESVPPTTEPEVTEPQITAPAALTEMLEANGSSLQELTGLACMQLVTVAVEGTEAQIDLYLLENNQWQRQELLSCGGYVGKNGAVDEKREGDKCTPRGLYSIEQAFYFAEAPVTGLPTFQITKDTYWVDDPESKYYNKRVEGTENQDWTSAEHMYRYSKSYEYGFVVGYNVEAVPYAGSAIFFHVSDHPTAGCIATDREFVLQYLAVLDETKNPYILIN